MSVSVDLTSELERADLDHWIEWMKAVGGIENDPYGVHVFARSSLTLLHVHGIPYPYYNRVVGLSERSLTELRSSLGFFAKRMTPCRVDVIPRTASPSVLMAMNDLGMHPTGFQSNMYAEIRSLCPVKAAPAVSVRPVREGEIGFFADLYERSYHGPRAPRILARFRKESILARAGRPGWRFYLAFVDGVPAGGAVLFVQGRIATLAGGATIYTLRGRGVQKAMLQRRIADAAEMGAEIVVSRCVAGSISEANMERTGLRISYVKSIWEHNSAA